jgi:hypothetical protein
VHERGDVLEQVAMKAKQLKITRVRGGVKVQTHLVAGWIVRNKKGDGS